MKIFLKKLSQMVILFCFSGILFSCEKKNLDTEKPYITFQNDIQDFYVISANPEGSLPSNVKNPSIENPLTFLFLISDHTWGLSTL